MPREILWRTELDGVLSAESGSLRLVIERADNCVRFRVLRRPAETGMTRRYLVASGTADNVRAATEAAERMLRRFERAEASTRQ